VVDGEEVDLEVLIGWYVDLGLPVKKDGAFAEAVELKNALTLSGSSLTSKRSIPCKIRSNDESMPSSFSFDALSFFKPEPQVSHAFPNTPLMVPMRHGGTLP
jgi:hypothetical protein